MRKWLAGAAYALALSGIAAPADAGAQGKWFEKVSRKIDEATAAKRKADSLRAAVRGTSSDEAEPTAASTSADGEVARAPRSGGRRRPGCTAYNTFQCAATAVVGEPSDGAIGGYDGGAKVIYRFTVDEPGVYRFALDPMPNNQGMYVSLSNAQYTDLARFDFEAGQPGARLHQFTASGTYYATLSGSRYQVPTQPFTFTVARNGRPRSAPAPKPAPDAGDAPACSQNNTFQCAEDAQLGEPITGAIGGNIRKLFYRVVVDEPGTLQFTLSPMPNRGGVRLRVTDDQYEQLGDLSYLAGQPRRQLLRLTAPGTYYVRLDVNGGGQNAERFVLTVKK